jgi:adenylate cyclase
MAVTRKLAAILAADVAGYSKLTSADEERTMARLRALRSDLIDPTIALHHGRVVKRTGDGALIEFRSVVDAVRCAIEVQNGMVERNTGLPPKRRIEFRAGIHLGDVVEESDGDLMGDGVNVAPRLGVSLNPAPSVSQSASTPPRLSIVVVTLANLGGEPEQEYFVDGVTESLTADLSRIAGSFVIGRNTALHLQFENSSSDADKFHQRSAPLDAQAGRRLR